MIIWNQIWIDSHWTRDCWKWVPTIYIGQNKSKVFWWMNFQVIFTPRPGRTYHE